MTQNEYVYAIFWRPEVASDVVSSENINTNEGCALLYFEADMLALGVSAKIKISHLRNA